MTRGSTSCKGGGDTRTSIDELDKERIVYIRGSRGGSSSEKVAHLDTSCRYCPENYREREVRKLPRIKGVCKCCTNQIHRPSGDKSLYKRLCEASPEDAFPETR